MLFCTDLDGTLYDDNKSVSKENLDAIEYFKAEGGLFTFITGRVPSTARDICNLINPNAPYGCINGAGIFDPKQNQYLWYASLAEDAIWLVRTIDAQLPEIGIQYNTENCVYFNKDNETMVNFRKVTGLPNISCAFEDVQEPVLKIVLGHEDEAQITALAELLQNHPKADQFDFIRSERTLYEILPKGVSKGGALGKMAEILHVDMAKTIAVGDYYNDISMIQAAGTGIAVSNAVDEAKQVADWITVGNNENAIAAIVEKYDIFK